MPRSIARFIAFPLLALSLAGSTLRAQEGFFHSWENRVRATSAKQPSWPVPVVAPASTIVQLARVDFIRQYTSTHTLTWNYDNGKGINFIPFARTEFDINLPPYIQHNTPKAADGAGDIALAAKYRMFAASEGGNYSTAVQVAFSIPTGSYKNGTAAATVTPSFVGGKGFGKFDIQSGIGGVLPTSSGNTIGKTILWNTVVQYRVGKYLWPELEVNSSYFHGGPNDGKNQTFLTPGLMVSKFKLRSDRRDRLALLVGGAMQIATSSYHSYNHGLILTSRLTF
ncbi:MAG TPA: transporter [Edaphobacter sp.]|nr:transporter [Edaphobacter sp.]